MYHATSRTEPYPFPWLNRNAFQDLDDSEVVYQGTFFIFTCGWCQREMGCAGILSSPES